MGSTAWSKSTYRSTSALLSSKPLHELYSAQKASPEYLVDSIEFRESRDSEAHPNAVPIIVGLDVSGSMGFIAEDMAKRSLGPIVEQSIDRFQDFDPHILFAAIGDAMAGDQYPCQITQFESDTRIWDQLTSLFLEGGGGGNQYESYDLAWAFAAQKTRSDAWDKRQRKGYLFTVGDEQFPERINQAYYKRAITGNHSWITPENVLADAQKMYHVFHVNVLEGNYNRYRKGSSETSWRQRLGNRLLQLDDHKNVASVIVAAIAVNEGFPVSEVVESFQTDSIRTSVANALGYNQQAFNEAE